MHSVVMFLKACIFIVLVVPMNTAPFEYSRHIIEIEWIDHDFQDVYVELGEHFEGDIVLTSSQKTAMQDSEFARNGLISSTSRWPDRSVVYCIVEEDFDEDQLNMIEDGMNDIANKSCITFRKSEKKDDLFVRIQGSENGCYSNVGFIYKKENKSDEYEEESQQVLNLHKDCFKHGTIVHEMLHTLGFYHMQSTFDRDNFVEIVWENIKSGKENNFAKYTADTVTDFGVPYDYTSVMHYPGKAFSKNGKETIIPLQENVTIGQRSGLSESDILKLNRMYCE